MDLLSCMVFNFLIFTQWNLVSHLNSQEFEILVIVRVGRSYNTKEQEFHIKLEPHPWVAIRDWNHYQQQWLSLLLLCVGLEIRINNHSTLRVITKVISLIFRRMKGFLFPNWEIMLVCLIGKGPWMNRNGNHKFIDLQIPI